MCLINLKSLEQKSLANRAAGLGASFTGGWVIPGSPLHGYGTLL